MIDMNEYVNKIRMRRDGIWLKPKSIYNGVITFENGENIKLSDSDISYIINGIINKHPHKKSTAIKEEMLKLLKGGQNNV